MIILIVNFFVYNIKKVIYLSRRTSKYVALCVCFSLHHLIFGDDFIEKKDNRLVVEKNLKIEV